MFEIELQQSDGLVIALININDDGRLEQLIHRNHQFSVGSGYRKPLFKNE